MPRVSRDEPQPFNRVVIRIIDVLDHLRARKPRAGERKKEPEQDQGTVVLSK